MVRCRDAKSPQPESLSIASKLDSQLLRGSGVLVVARPRRFKGYVRPEWVSFAAAVVVVGELATLSRFATPPLDGIFEGLAAAGAVIVAALAPRRM
jgi:hypothetical protein